jgi:hypothetical protein
MLRKEILSLPSCLHKQEGFYDILLKNPPHSPFAKGGSLKGGNCDFIADYNISR